MLIETERYLSEKTQEASVTPASLKEIARILSYAGTQTVIGEVIDTVNHTKEPILVPVEYFEITTEKGSIKRMPF